MARQVRDYGWETAAIIWLSRHSIKLAIDDL